MSALTVPLAPVGGGRAPSLEVDTPQTGAMVAEFGSRIARIGDAMEEDRLTRELGRTRVSIARELGNLRLTYGEATDPDQIDQGWQADAGALRQRLVDAADPRLREAVGQGFDELADRHAMALGTRAIDLRHAERRATEMEQGAEIVRQAATSDPDTRAALMAQYDAGIRDMVRAGTYTPEEGARLMLARRTEADTAAATRALTDRPDSLLAEIDAGGYQDMDPSQREGLRARALAEIAARAEAQAVEARRAAKEAESRAGDRLGTAIAALDAGRPAADMAALMSDPVAQAHPKYAEFAAAALLRQTLPGFSVAPPPDQARAIAAEEARPVKAEHELKTLAAMKRAHEASKTAWAADPIAEAAARLGSPPPALPAFDAARPEVQVAALKARADYARSLASLGYVRDPVYFSKAERETLATHTGVDRPPAQRAQLAAALVAGLGRDASRAVTEIGGDPVFLAAGSLIAAGGDLRTATRAFEGQQALAARTVSLPGQKVAEAAQSSATGQLFAGMDSQLGHLRRLADAIYARRARDGAITDPEGFDAETEYAAAMQEAMGQTTAPDGTLLGGAQEVNGRLTLLPAGIAPAAVEGALSRISDRMRGTDGPARLGQATPPEPADAIWAQARLTPGLPAAGGTPVTASVLRDAALVASGPDRYQIVITRRGVDMVLEDSTTGTPFEFALTRLSGVRP